MSIFPKFFLTLFKSGLVRPIWERVSALYLDFLNDNYIVSGTPSTLSSYVTHSRSGNATMVDSDGLIKWAPHNLLTYSEDLTGTGWIIQSGVTVTVNQETAPDGTLTADKIAGDGISGVFAMTSLAAGFVVTRAIWLKGVSGGEAVTLKDPVATITQLTCNLTTEWQLFELEENNGAASAQGLWVDDIPAGGIYAWGAHLYRSDLGGMVDNPDRGDSYVPTTSSSVYLPRRGHHVYNGSTWVNEGLLVESESRQNICLQSEDLSTTWDTADSAITTNTVISPDGATTADTFTTSGIGYSSVYQTVTAVSGVTYTASVYAKAGTASTLGLEFRGSGFSPDAIFDLSSGTVSSGTGTIEDVGNNWYRCSITEAAVNTSELFIIGRGASGAIGDTIYLWGAQVEAGSTPSSYIPTAGSAITRAAETLTIPSANLPYPTPNVIGSELFDSNVANWSRGFFSVDGTLVYDSGSDTLTHTLGVGDTSGARWTVPISCAVGDVFLLTGNITYSGTAGGVGLTTNSSGTGFSSANSITTGTTEVIVVATASPMYLTITSSGIAGDTTSASNISVKEIDPLSVSIQMDGRMTYADTNSNPEARLFHWVSGANYIRFDLRTDSTRTGGMSFYQSPPATQVASSDLYYSPDILVPFNIAGRHGSTFLNGALSGTALTANTTPTALPDLSSTDLDLAQNYMGTIRTFRIWDADLTDEGIAYVSERSEEPTISLSFNSSESSFTVSDWLP